MQPIGSQNPLKLRKTTSNKGFRGVLGTKWLNMHGLPDGPPLCVERGNHVQNLLGRALSAFALVQIILIPGDHGCHGVLVEDAAAEPEVGNALRVIKRVHPNRKVLQPFLVLFVDRPLP